MSEYRVGFDAYGWMGIEGVSEVFGTASRMAQRDGTPPFSLDLADIAVTESRVSGSEAFVAGYAVFSSAGDAVAADLINRKLTEKSRKGKS